MESIYKKLDFDSKKNLLWELLKINLRHETQAVGDSSGKTEIYEDIEGIELSKNFIDKYDLSTLSGILEMKKYYDTREAVNDFKTTLNSLISPQSNFQIRNDRN